ncbi:MAG: serine/threonine-protein kinase [Cyanobacteria bacterium P01_F01_bin.3]
MTLATRSISNYALQAELSTDSKRQVGKRTFLAEDTRTQDAVIVKIIQLDRAIKMADQWTEVKLFKRETNLLQALSHPAIPKYRDYFEATIDGINSLVLVQSYVEADSLESLMAAGKRFSEADVLSIAQQLLNILKYLHSQSPPVIHRDIKPSNILLSLDDDGPGKMAPGLVSLIDFGSVHTNLSKEAGTITIVGSYGYIPLEQFSGQATPASDLYSLGMTLIQLLTGTHPEEIPQVDGRIQLQQYTHISWSLAQWLIRMTEPYLDKRFDSAELALNALKAQDSHYGSYEHLKPAGTQVKIQCDRNQIEILTPKPGLSLINVGKVATWLAAPVYWGVITPLMMTLGRPLWFIPLGFGWLVLCWVKLAAVLPTRMRDRGRQGLVIDREQGIYKGSSRFYSSKIHWQRTSSYMQEIDLLAYNPGYTFQRSDKDTIEQAHSKPKLSIHAGDVEYTIGHVHLSPAEFWWIGQALSDFLGLELQTIYPTPIVKVSNAGDGGCGC